MENCCLKCRITSIFKWYCVITAPRSSQHQNTKTEAFKLKVYRLREVRAARVHTEAVSKGLTENSVEFRHQLHWLWLKILWLSPNELITDLLIKKTSRQNLYSDLQNQTFFWTDEYVLKTIKIKNIYMILYK